MNYTLQDTSSVIRATAAFSLLLYFPGYLLGFLTNICNFRRLSLAARSAWATGLSFCVVPFLLGSLPLPVAAWLTLFCATAIVGLWLMRRSGGLRPNELAVLAFVAAGSLLILLELIDVEHAGRLYINVAALDQQYRVAFIGALSRSLAHPANPLYHPGHPVPLRYYYFWYGLCAVCMPLAHVGARAALIASSIWTGVGLIAVAALCLRYVFRVEHQLRRRVLLCACLLGVTGADILPVLANLATHEPFAGDLEWWSSDQVASWLDSVLWVPHHTAALLSAVMAFVLLWLASRSAKKNAFIAIAAIAGASTFGLSVYVAIGFALLMLCWMARLAMRERAWRTIGLIALSGGLASILLLPFVHQLLQAESGTQAGHAASAGHLLQFGVRKMIDSTLISSLPAFSGWNATFVDQSVRLLLLLPGYGVELGFWGLVLLLCWRRRRTLDEARGTVLYLAVCGLIVVTFIRSAVIENNDFGYRAVLLPSFFLLLLGSDFVLRLRQETRATRTLAVVLLTLGVAGTLFQGAALRLFLPVQERCDPTPRGLSTALLGHRRVFESAASRLPPGTVLQANQPDPRTFFAVANMLFTAHAMATDGAQDCGSVFGGDPQACPALRADLRLLFDGDTVDPTPVCTRWGIGALVVTRADPVWNDPESWVWSLPPAAQAADIRILSCAANVTYPESTPARQSR